MSHACLNRQTPTSDDGQIDPLLGQAEDDLGRLSVLGESRVFVPVVPVVTTELAVQETDGGDAGADMATVMLTGRDGRKALLCFTSLAAMTTWNAKSRPVAVKGAEAAQVALADGASAILLDVASQGFSVVETDDLQHLAQGDRLMRTPQGVAWVLA